MFHMNHFTLGLLRERKIPTGDGPPGNRKKAYEKKNAWTKARIDHLIEKNNEEGNVSFWGNPASSGQLRRQV